MKSEGYCEITSKTGKGEKKERKKEWIASKYDVKNLPDSLGSQPTPKTKVHHFPFCWSLKP